MTKGYGSFFVLGLFYVRKLGLDSSTMNWIQPLEEDMGAPFLSQSGLDQIWLVFLLFSVQFLFFPMGFAILLVGCLIPTQLPSYEDVGENCKGSKVGSDPLDLWSFFFFFFFVSRFVVGCEILPYFERHKNKQAQNWVQVQQQRYE